MLIPIPQHWRLRYKILRGLMYALAILAAGIFALRTLFPTLVFSFNFRTPNSSKNNILNPRTPDNVSRANGKIERGGALIANLGTAGNFAQAETEVAVEKKSGLPENLELTLRRSYRSFMLPDGAPITDFPEAKLYKINDTYYELRDNTLYPFVSESAYQTRYPTDFAAAEAADFLSRYPVSEDPLGFRVGSIVSFADGVFLITSETEMRPVGSADIFLSLGYRFENVKPASEEEIGIYKRGKIFNLGEQHPDGTLLLDQDTGKYYLTEQNAKRQIVNERYLNFLLQQQIPVRVSSRSNETRVGCILQLSFFGQSFSCAADLTPLAPSLGPDFEITLGQNDTDIDINTLSVSLKTKKSAGNMLTLLSQIKQRVLARFGYE